jgi:hypothetical protein
VLWDPACMRQTLLCAHGGARPAHQRRARARTHPSLAWYPSRHPPHSAITAMRLVKFQRLYAPPHKFYESIVPRPTDTTDAQVQSAQASRDSSKPSSLFLLIYCVHSEELIARRAVLVAVTLHSGSMFRPSCGARARMRPRCFAGAAGHATLRGQVSKAGRRLVPG